MSDQYCFLCASDEGIFLDITPDNRALFVGQLESCLSVKINKNIEVSNKICYKCAYELEQCSNFIQKCKKSHEDLKHSLVNTSTLHCCLCFEYVESTHFFDIAKDNNSIFSPIQKIRNIFNKDLTKENSNSTLICLTCRYSLDVLYDLKKLYQETVTNRKALADQEIDYSTFPKVHTDVVNRKTTVSTFPDDIVFVLVSSDSDNETMARKKSSGKKGHPRKFNITKSKTRNCDKCRNIVADGHDMYRFHRTGLTVCKSCWITIDPSNRSNRSKVKVKRREQNQTTETKLCTVFLKDVLNEKTYKAESGKDGNKLYIISEDSSQDEDRSQSVSPKVKGYTINGSARRGRKRRVGATKSNDETSIKSEPRELRGSRKRLKKVELPKASSDTEQPSTSSLKQRGRKPRAVRHSDRNSDSDILHLTAGKPSNLAKRHHPSSSDAEQDADKKKKNKRRPTLEKEDLVVNVAASEPSDELSSNEGGMSLRKTKSRNPSITSVASTNKTEIENKRETRRRTRLSSLSSKEMTPPTEFKSPKSVTSEVETEYHCDKCNKKFDSKLLSAEHRLTHLKQATLKLEKINILNDEQKKTKIDTEENETFTETEVHSDKNITDKQDLSEEIAINVEDDTDDEEFSLSTNENARQMEKKEEHNEGSDNNNANDKSDTMENISPTLLKEESVKIQNEDKMITEESQQCEDSTFVLTQDSIDTVIILSSDKEENKNIDDTDTETVKSKNLDTSKDDSSQEVTVATVENNADLKINRNEVTTADNDTKKEAVTECNNDKEIFDSGTACNNKTTESATLTITKNNNDNINTDNKDHDKKIMDDLGNGCKDNENETIQNIEFCDLTNDSQTKDTKELEKKKDTMDSVNNLGTLKDTKVINDVIADEEKVEDSEMYQNRIDEQNKEIEIIVHVNKSSTLGDFIKSNMSNCKEVNKTKDNTDGDDIAILSDNDDVDNDDTSRSKKVTKETSTMNDLTEKKEWMGNKNDFQQLLENDVSEKGEVQENANHSYSDNNSTNTASEILKEVFDLAAAEVQKRENINNTKSLSDETEMETLENISREIRNSADMPSLDPIVMEVDDDDDITLT